MNERVPVACTVAGSDSGGGAGLQADLRTFAFHRVHGCSAVTALTVQNTCTVAEVLPVDPRFVLAQLEAVSSDFGLDALKCGLLGRAEVVHAVAAWVEGHPALPVVLDPVMVSRHGVRFVDDATVEALRGALFRRATLVTPNRREAEELTGLSIHNADDAARAAVELVALGANAALVKGGSLGGDERAHDVLATREGVEHFVERAVPTSHTHGTGCTLAAAITARLARGEPLREAVMGAKQYVQRALEHSLAIGHGQGPVGHFWPLVGRTDAP
jgi:hydroxymethylpyrimidine/phosphomethylpyrimidine kinase